MTLMDLIRLIRRYWVLLLAMTLLFGAAGFGVALLRHDASDQASATAIIVGNSQSQGVKGAANEEGRRVVFNDGTKLEDSGCEYKLEVEIEKESPTVMVTVSGPDENECIIRANQIAEGAYQKALEWYPEKENSLAYSGYVEKASSADVVKAQGPNKKLIFGGILAGLFLGICAIVVFDLIRRPVKSIEGMQDAVGLPVLEKLPATNGERLLANVRFASKVDDLKRVCVVPLGEDNLADEVAELLCNALKAEQAVGSVAASKAAVATEGISREASDAVYDEFYVQSCAPLAAGMGAAYESRGADAVLVAACQWKDKLAALETTVAELRLAGANVVGLVFKQS